MHLPVPRSTAIRPTFIQAAKETKCSDVNTGKKTQPASELAHTFSSRLSAEATANRNSHACSLKQKNTATVAQYGQTV